MKIITGASNDLQRATDIAEQMVGTFGMSDILGPLAYDKQGGGQFLEMGIILGDQLVMLLLKQ